jgi:hypothetical protein
MARLCWRQDGATVVIDRPLEARRGFSLPAGQDRIWGDRPGHDQHRHDEGRQVAQAFTVLEALRRPDDPGAELESLRARLELGRLEGRDPGLLAALESKLAILEGRLPEHILSSEARLYLHSDASTCARWER